MKSWHLLRVEDPEIYLLFNLLINYEMVLINILPLYPAVLFMLLPVVSSPSQPSPGVSLGDLSWNPSGVDTGCHRSLSCALVPAGPKVSPGGSGTGRTSGPATCQSFGKCTQPRGFAPCSCVSIKSELLTLSVLLL